MFAGKKWSSVWSPTGGAKGREGDRICKLVADNMTDKVYNRATVSSPLDSTPPSSLSLSYK